MENLQPNNNIIPPRQHKSPVKIIVVSLAIVLVLAVAGGIYAYIAKIGPFAIYPYTEKNLLSGVSLAVSKINSASYSLSASLSMDKRDKDAAPFTTKLSNEEELKTQYQNDAKRAQNISFILTQIPLRLSKGVYPQSLQSFKDLMGKVNKYSVESFNDPVTNKPYDYALTENGNNFSITTTFETSAAISSIRKLYKFSDSTTKINGKTVTFTKDSYSYFYLPTTPPDPFLVSMAKTLNYIPPDFKVNAAVSAKSDLSNKDSAAWSFNLDGSGDFGDLTYKVNVDVMRKNGVYYFKINNLPIFFYSYIGFEKGKWVKVDPSKLTESGTYSYNPFSGISDAEKYYKENRDKVTNLLKNVVKIASDDNLISLKDAPHTDTINGRKLFGYDLQIRKDAILKFYQDLQEEVNKSNLNSNTPIINDTGYLEYLKSPEFNEAFDYYQNNTELTLWVDSQGFPALITYKIRVVPQDSAVQLKDKQVGVTFKLQLSDINKSVDINAPSDAKDIMQAMRENPIYQQSTDASIKANLSVLLVSGATFYDSNHNYNGFCPNAEVYIKTKKTIDDAYGTGSSVVCSCDTAYCSLAKKWCASALLASGKYFCVDSGGAKIESSKTNVCSNGFCIK